MAIIALEGIHFFGRHGFYEEEQIIGNRFIMDVWVDAETSMAAIGDDLSSTINYETLFLICQVHIKKPARLLETLAQNIMDQINDHFEMISGVKVKIRKLNPPLGGRVASASVEVSSGSLSGAGLLRGLGKESDMGGDFMDFFKNL